jgi:hypothetical protein
MALKLGPVPHVKETDLVHIRQSLFGASRLLDHAPDAQRYAKDHRRIAPREAILGILV